MKMSEYKKGEIKSLKNVLMMIEQGFTVEEIEFEINLDIHKIEKQAEENGKKAG